GEGGAGRAAIGAPPAAPRPVGGAARSPWAETFPPISRALSRCLRPLLAEERCSRRTESARRAARPKARRHAKAGAAARWRPTSHFHESIARPEHLRSRERPTEHRQPTAFVGGAAL